MSTANLPHTAVASRIAHWLGCVLGTGLVALFAAFAFGGREEPPPVSPATLSLGVMLIGYLLAWWRDLLGAFVSLAGFVAFYALMFFSSGTLPGGPVFPLCFVPGVLCLLAVWWRHNAESAVAHR